jgi:hypothetical protein
MGNDAMTKFRELFPPYRPDFRIDAILLHLDDITHTLGLIMSALDDLTAAVAAAGTVEASAVTLVQGIVAQLTAALAASGTPDPALVSLTAELTASTAALSAAVTANTPAAPVPTP